MRRGTLQHGGPEGFLEFLEAMRTAQLKLLIARLPRILHLQPVPANDD